MKKQDKEQVLNMLENTRKNNSFLVINNDSVLGNLMLSMDRRIKYDNIYKAYAKPSQEKVNAFSNCELLVEAIKDDIDGTVIIKGIEGCNIYSFNYFAKIKSSKYNKIFYLYCTSKNKYLTVLNS